MYSNNINIMIWNINIVICLPMKHCPSFFEWILSILIMLLLKLTWVMRGSFAQCSVNCRKMFGHVVSEILPSSECQFIHFVHYPHFLFQKNFFASFVRKNLYALLLVLGFSTGSVVKNSSALQELQETLVLFLGWEDPLKEEMATNASILA